MESASRFGRTRWLVDGLNVIGSRPNGWWRDRRGAMRELVDRLRAHAEATGEAVTVVFDGKPFELSAAGEAGVAVIFASRGGPDAADDEIVERVAAEEDPSSVAVVTSDAQLAARVRALGLEVISSGSFRHRLDSVASRGGRRGRG
jgi:predicted RNA-binding protein with PIN domain